MIASVDTSELAAVVIAMLLEPHDSVTAGEADDCHFFAHVPASFFSVNEPVPFETVSVPDSASVISTGWANVGVPSG